MMRPVGWPPSSRTSKHSSPAAAVAAVVAGDGPPAAGEVVEEGEEEEAEEEEEEEAAAAAVTAGGTGRGRRGAAATDRCEQRPGVVASRRPCDSDTGVASRRTVGGRKAIAGSVRGRDGPRGRWTSTEEGEVMHWVRVEVSSPRRSAPRAPKSGMSPPATASWFSMSW